MFEIEFIKLKVKIKLKDHSILPIYKESAIRGGIAEILRKGSCDTNDDCDKCKDREDCLYTNTIYSNYEIKPKFITKGESVGFVLSCDNRKENFMAGDILSFTITLLGKTINYFNDFVQSIIKLGKKGLGKYAAKFKVVTIEDSQGQILWKNENYYMDHFCPTTVSDYIVQRKQQKGGFGVLCFKTPCTIKFESKFIKEFHMQAIMNSIYRRIYMLNCFIGNDCLLYYPDKRELPVITKQYVNEKEVRRYSSYREMAIMLKGIEGFAWLGDIQEHLLDYLLAAEVVHIGKNTRFGFGKCRLI